MGMNTMAVFDFDGTITRKDTLLEFIKFAKGKRAFYIGFLRHALVLIAYRLKIYPNWKAKQRIFTYFFGGMLTSDFDSLCEDFFRQRGKRLIYDSAAKQIKDYINRHIEIVIISASIENWILPFACHLGVEHVLGTKLEINKDGQLTGRFLTANCYGAEKVKRLNELLPERSNYYLIAYGDSRGDRELLAYADERHYKFFQ